MGKFDWGRSDIHLLLAIRFLCVYKGVKKFTTLGARLPAYYTTVRNVVTWDSILFVRFFHPSVKRNPKV